MPQLKNQPQPCHGLREFCGASIQKGGRYTQGEAMIFRAFIRLRDDLVTHNPCVEICEVTELPSGLEVWRGEPSLEAFDVLWEKPSVEGQRNGITDADSSG